MSPQDAYNELIKKTKEVSLIASCYAVLDYDQQCFMPPKGAQYRAAQTSMLAGLAHEKFTDPKINDLLAAVEGSDLVKDPESVEAVNVREIRREYDKETKLPKELVEEFSKTTSLAHAEWVKARKESNFKHFEPWLAKVLDLTLKKAEAYGYEGEPYNALLDNYEPGATVDDVVGVFEDLRNELVPLVAKIKDAKKKPDESIIERTYKTDLQAIFGEIVAASLGYDFEAGRLDIAAHPFTNGLGVGDTRITTRYNPHRLNDALYGTMHETGHALYEMGIDKETHSGTPMGESTSLGIHESQSRLWENQVGRSKEFWVYYLPIAKRIFRDALKGVELDDIYGAVNYVKPSYIRVEADEATYNLHILLRFEMEREMLNGNIKAADVAGEWNERFKKYLGIEVDKDANGCLQDVHWSMGLIGYFPTYTLGTIYSAQFFAQANKEMPDLMEQFKVGNFLGLREWLRENIHKHGQRYRANDLCKKVTGETISHKPLMDYMNKKFGEIYGI